MTRKDYIAIAAAFASHRPIGVVKRPLDTYAYATTDHAEQWLTDRAAIADSLAADNPRFDRQRFYNATEGK